MPLSSKGNKIMQAMKGQYGDKKGEEVFYASKNAGKISGVEATHTKTMERFARNLARRSRGG